MTSSCSTGLSFKPDSPLGIGTPEIAASVSEPLSRTEKIILFGEGGATSMARDTAGTMLQSFEAIKQAVGLDIPKMLKDVSTGGLVGRAAIEDTDTASETSMADNATTGTDNASIGSDVPEEN